MTRHGSTSGSPTNNRTPYRHARRPSEPRDPLKQWIPIPPALAEEETVALMNMALDAGHGLVKRGDAKRLGLMRRNSLLKKTYPNTPAGRREIRAYLEDLE